MYHEEVERHYGPYLAELIRQSTTLEDYDRLEVEELGSYFALRAARAYEEFLQHEKEAPPALDDGRVLTASHYEEILRRRWQVAEELAQMIIHADREADERSLYA